MSTYSRALCLSLRIFIALSAVGASRAAEDFPIVPDDFEVSLFASREGLPVSAMSAGFGSILTSQQIADLTAFLLSQKKSEPLKAANGSFRSLIEDGEGGIG